MYTIKQTARLTGVPPGTLRSWERRYAVVRPTRNESGYRVYDKSVIAAIIGLRTLIDSGWAPAEAARAIEEGKVQCSSAAATELTALPDRVQDQWTAASHAFKDFLRSAARLDSLGLNDSLDRGFALGPFEHVVDYWLFPALTALGDGWAGGQIDVAGEHLASQAVRSRLSGAFEAAGWRSRGPSVLVGLPPGSHHDLGALAFAVMTKRRGLDVHYLGADLPTRSGSPRWKADGWTPRSSRYRWPKTVRQRKRHSGPCSQRVLTWCSPSAVPTRTTWQGTFWSSHRRPAPRQRSSTSASTRLLSDVFRPRQSGFVEPSSKLCKVCTRLGQAEVCRGFARVSLGPESMTATWRK